MNMLDKWLFQRRIERSLRARKALRPILSERAQRGVSTYWRKAGQKCRETFGV